MVEYQFKTVRGCS